MIKLYIYCSVFIIGNVEVGLDIGLKFHQVMEIVSYDRKKLASLVVTLSQAKPLKALKIDGLYTTRAPTILIQPEEDDTVIIRNVAWILISAITLVLVGLILKKMYKLHCYKS